MTHNKSKGHHIAFSGGGDQAPEDAHFFSLPITDHHSHLYIGMLKQHNIYSFKFTFQPNTENTQQIQHLNYTPATTSSDSSATNNITVHLKAPEDNSSDTSSGQLWECFFSACQRGETAETISFTTPSGNEIKVDIGAKIIRPDLGTPILKNGIKCVGKTSDAPSEVSDWGGFDKEESDDGDDEGEDKGES